MTELKKIPDESIDCIITSPPYLGLRDYGEETKVIWDGDENCVHDFSLKTTKMVGNNSMIRGKNETNSGAFSIPKFGGTAMKQEIKEVGAFCKKCGAWRGQLGLEPTLDLYINHLLQITAELKRVLKKSGVLWWNHGDCYGGSGCGKGDYREDKSLQRDIYNKPNPQLQLTPKCLALQNWRLILRMIDEQGWTLRNVIIWHKLNAMPSSVKDRFANRYEPVFMMVKSKKYFFNLDAVRVMPKTHENRPYGIVREREFGYNTFYPEIRKKSAAYNWELRNTPNPMEWRKNAFNYRVRDAEKKSSQCPQFKATKKEIEKYKKEWQKQKELSYGNDDKGARRSRVMAWLNTKDKNQTTGKGKNPGDVWSLSSQPLPKKYRGKHFAAFTPRLVEPIIKASCPEGGVVLDPFMGSGTTGVVAKKLGRNYVGIELNKEYAKMAEERIGETVYQENIFSGKREKK